MKEETRFSTYECPNCGKTVYAREEFDFDTCLFQFYAKCSNCDYEVNTKRDATLNEVRKEAGLEPVEEVKVDELLTNPEPNSATSTPGVDIGIPTISAKLRDELTKEITKDPHPCGFCGSFMSFKGLVFSRDFKYMIGKYECPTCGRYCEKHREIYNYGVQVLDNGDIVKRGDTDGDSGQYPCEDNDCMDYKAEYEKLYEKNKELEHQIEIYIKVLEEKEENCKRCMRPDYEAEREKLREECEKLREECESLRRQKADLKRQNEHHCRALMLIRDLIDII